MQEEWRDVLGSNGIYQVSSFGRVRSYNNRHHAKMQNPKYIKGHNLKGYIQVYISGKMKLVHRLVAEAFIPNPEEKPFINHKDGNRDNNYIDNLEWVTQSENMRHSYDILKQPLPPGNPKPVKCIETGVIYSSAREAEKDTGVLFQNIGKVALARANGGKWQGHTYLTAGGFTWEFVNKKCYNINRKENTCQ